MYKPKHSKDTHYDIYTYYDVEDFVSKLLDSIDEEQYFHLPNNIFDDFIDLINKNSSRKVDSNEDIFI